MSDLCNPGRHRNAGTHQAREAYCSRMYLSVVVRTPLCVDVELATSGVEESRPAGGHATPLFKVQFQPISWRRRARCRAEDGGREATTAEIGARHPSAMTRQEAPCGLRRQHRSRSWGWHRASVAQCDNEEQVQLSSVTSGLVSIRCPAHDTAHDAPNTSDLV